MDGANNGPDQILSATKYFTSEPNGAVLIRESPEVDLVPRSVPSRFTELANLYPDKNIIAYKNDPEDDVFQFITMREYLKFTRTVAKAFIELGLGQNEAISIIGSNCPRWSISYLAAIFAGGVGSGMYVTNTAHACYTVLKKANVKIVLVENEVQLAKVLECRDRLPNLQTIIQYEGEVQQAGVMNWKEIMDIGNALPDDALEERLRRIAVNQCCCLLFTSGTTGDPKVAMLSHDNFNIQIRLAMKAFGLKRSDRLICHLPLSHVAAQIFDVFGNILYEPFTVYYANKDALKGSLFRTIKEVRPTFLLTVPRVIEKLADSIKQHYQVQDNLNKWALEVAGKRFQRLITGDDVNSLEQLVATDLVYSKIKESLGLDCLGGSLYSGAAPIALETKKIFLGADLIVLTAYGLTENTGVALYVPRDRPVLDASGKNMTGCPVKIVNCDENNVGEVAVNGRIVFMGYLGEENSLRACTDSEGWLFTGDLATVNNEGFFKFTGRGKEILVTSGGENIAPLDIEGNIKAELPFLSQVMIVANERKFPSALLTLTSLTDEETGMPSDALHELSLKWLELLGLPYKKVSDVIASGPHQKILDSIQRGIDAANEKAISTAQTIKKFLILPHDFSTATGELGPTLKLKRQFVADKYKSMIDKMYE